MSEYEYPPEAVGLPPKPPLGAGERLREIAEREAAAAEQEPPPVEVDDVHGEQPPDDPYVDTCPTCKGWGRTLTGSLVEGEQARTCVDCSGVGWQERLVLERNGGAERHSVRSSSPGPLEDTLRERDRAGDALAADWPPAPLTR